MSARGVRRAQTLNFKRSDFSAAPEHPVLATATRDALMVLACTGRVSLSGPDGSGHLGVRPPTAHGSCFSSVACWILEDPRWAGPRPPGPGGAGRPSSGGASRGGAPRMLRRQASRSRRREPVAPTQSPLRPTRCEVVAAIPDQCPPLGFATTRVVVTQRAARRAQRFDCSLGALCHRRRRRHRHPRTADSLSSTDHQQGVEHQWALTATGRRLWITRRGSALADTP